MIQPRTLDSTDSDSSAQSDSDTAYFSSMSSPSPSDFSSISIDNDSDIEEPLGGYGAKLIGENACVPKFKAVSPLTLDSFVPIIEQLPGIILSDDKVYSLPAQLSPKVLEDLRLYTYRIQELALTDSNLHGRSVSSTTIMELGLLLGCEELLLPSLKHLHLADANSDHIYLFLCFCLTSPLETIDISGIPQRHHLTISHFLNKLNNNARPLRRITLGPGLLSESILHGFTQFSSLRELSLIDVAETLNFNFLQAASALPELETFIIDARTASYTTYNPPETLLQGGESQRGANDIHDSSTSGNAVTERFSIHLHYVPFPRLSRLSVVSKVTLMGDLLFHLFPSKIKELSLTLVRDAVLPIPEYWNYPSFDSYIPDSQVTPDMEYESLDFEEHDPFLQLSSSMPLPAQKPILTNQTDASQDGELGFNTNVQIAHFSSVVRTILKNATPGPNSIFIDRLDAPSIEACASETHINPPMFPPATFRELLACKCLVTLKIENWALISFNQTFNLFDLFFSTRLSLSMQDLQLPVNEELNSGITPQILDAIARRYPSLLRLQTRFASFSLDNVKDQYTPHTLQELSVAGGSPLFSQQTKFVPYLYSRFPNLEGFTTHNECDKQDWGRMQELIDMIKTHDNMRLNKVLRT